MSELIQFSDTVRIERGPVRKRAVATAEAIEARRPAIMLAGGTTVEDGPFDSAGKKMQEGQEFEYINRREQAWHVYQLQDGRYVEVGLHPTLEAAQSQAGGL